MELNLKCENKQEEIVKKYLEANASEHLANKINFGKKTLAGFFHYASEQARKEAEDGVACIEDSVVFGWATHYFEEDAIKEPEQPKEKPKKKAPAKKEEPIKVEPKKPEHKKGDKIQLSLFDL